MTPKVKSVPWIFPAFLLITASAAAEEAGGGFLDGVKQVNDAVNGVVWGVPALVLLAFVGTACAELDREIYPVPEPT